MVVGCRLGLGFECHASILGSWIGPRAGHVLVPIYDELYWLIGGQP